jgi:hypothetical protein
MNFIRTRLIQPLRTLLVTVTCALFLLLNVSSALAAGHSTPSKATEGEAQLNKIYDRSEDMLQNGIPSLEQVEKRANEGINEVQGDADKDKMSRPGNSQQAVSVKDQIKKSLEKASIATDE